MGIWPVLQHLPQYKRRSGRCSLGRSGSSPKSSHRGREHVFVKAICSQQGAVAHVDQRSDPVAKPGEAIVVPTRLALDEADLRASCDGFAGILGHEFVGIVSHVNLPDDHPLARRLANARVVGDAHIPCGSCELCKAGLSLHCPNATMLGLKERDGCFAERFAIPAANLVPLEDALDDDRAIFSYALGRVLHASHMLKLEGKNYVTVLGDNVLALLAAQVMASQNASVRLLGTRLDNLEQCTKWSVKHRLWHEVGQRHDQDIVFDCTGSPEALELALGLVRPRGSIVLVHSTKRASAIAVDAIVDHELQVFGSRGSAIGHAVAMLHAHQVDVLSLIERRLRFDDAPKVFTSTLVEGSLKLLFDAA